MGDAYSRPPFGEYGDAPVKNRPDPRHTIRDLPNVHEQDPPKTAAALTLQDGGTRETFSTGAQKEDKSKCEGKGAYHLLPQEPLRQIAEIYRLGAIKYAPNNWRKGIPLSRLLDSAMRHSAQFVMGMEDENHAAQAAWNWLAIIDTLTRIKRGQLPEELNDLWSEGEPGEEVEVRPGYVCSQWRGKGPSCT